MTDKQKLAVVTQTTYSKEDVAMIIRDFIDTFTNHEVLDYPEHFTEEYIDETLFDIKERN